ncbi:MAG: CDP-diacylglycerol--serine O-phosphatidyltransferase [Alphaproteobacteria bacterium]|nr:CDP-diacylglycerol--serine O-phosphatidyltransferase [Alphaproteobacteria bacterium]
MSKRNRQKVFQILPLGKIIPNLATLSALFVGMMQIKFSLAYNWEFAILAVIGAAFLDAMDGRLARMFNACSRFGAELDSLSDFAVFGVSPAVVIYIFSLHNFNRLGWMISALFAICMALRLARFNTNDIENRKSPLSGSFFTGVPAPAGAVLGLFPIILYNATGCAIFKNPIICAANMLIVGILCISKIPTPSIKKFKIHRSQYTAFLLLVIITLGAAYAYTWKTLCIVVIAYIISIFISYSKSKKLLMQHKDDNHTATL